VLINHSAQTISIAFPNYDRADSLIQSPRFPGLFARQARLDLIYRIELDDPGRRDSLVAELTNYHEVYFAEKNATRQECFEPNDDYFGLQWGMHSDNCSFCADDADINAPEAWDLVQGRALTVIGIIDKGVYQNHIEFQDRISGEGPGDSDHDTHVAGIAAAEGNNNEGVAGVTWHSHIYSKDISGFDEVDIYDSILDAVFNHGADVLNNSWGGSDFHSLENQAFGIAHDMGVLSVAARGNNIGDAPYFPACNYGDYILSVGAFNHLKELSDFSGYGYGIDILAPGGTTDGRDENDIYSTYYRSGNQYAYDRGTSMAAPHVTGMVGLLDRYNYLRSLGSNFYQIITRTATDMYEIGYDDLSGYGRLNARAALDFISPPNRLNTCSVSSAGNYLVDPDPPAQPWEFKGTRELPDNRAYLAKQYEVRNTVDYMGCSCDPPVNDPVIGTPIVWGLDSFTNGWGPSNPNGGVRKCDVIFASENGAILRTYVYEVWEFTGYPEWWTYRGFFPNHWQDCVFGFTLLVDGTPLPPVNLAVSPSSTYHPLLTWDDSPTSDVIGYKVYRLVHGIDQNWLILLICRRKQINMKICNIQRRIVADSRFGLMSETIPSLPLINRLNRICLRLSS